MIEKYAYILIGDNNTGKTVFQKELIKLLSFEEYDKLHCNKVFEIRATFGKLKYKEIFIINRSYQEKIEDYKSVQKYFQKYFIEGEIAILSSHLILKDIEEMIKELRKKFYNICGVFFSNSISKNQNQNMEISLLEWNKRLIIENPPDQNNWQEQLKREAMQFAINIINQ